MCVCVYTHVESGSLSLLPRPGILKAFARLFFPPSGAKAVMYSSKPTRAADGCIQKTLVLFHLHKTVWTVDVFMFLNYHESWSSCAFKFYLLFYPCCEQVKHSFWWAACTWPVFARALLLCKLLDEVIDSNVFHILLEFLVNLQRSKTEWFFCSCKVTFHRKILFC